MIICTLRDIQSHLPESPGHLFAQTLEGRVNVGPEPMVQVGYRQQKTDLQMVCLTYRIHTTFPISMALPIQ